MSEYRECIRNHAASLGAYATDGCLEFAVDQSGPDPFRCAACGCHRSFHRKDTGGTDAPRAIYFPPSACQSPEGRKKRTKFTEEQKVMMAMFAERIGWKMQGRAEEVMTFCREIGVSREVFKVWMHNHKHGAPSCCSSNRAADAIAATAASDSSESVTGGGDGGADPASDDDVEKTP